MLYLVPDLEMTRRWTTAVAKDTKDESGNGGSTLQFIVITTCGEKKGALVLPAVCQIDASLINLGSGLKVTEIEKGMGQISLCISGTTQLEHA
ncbi:hypothetical protein CVT25_003192 [Psilocybe cyanescens]|uniref:Uncharacterized protein n=1 Tax=Psilocybe cyanescens TaxID=93625 RepID=A0A409XF37_PSICY|nr:hypothetical protein CVT25_003192 [Psilocybe cyanescens]